jgi:hypothetical protein
MIRAGPMTQERPVRPVYDPSTQFLDPQFLSPTDLAAVVAVWVDVLTRWLFGG